MDAAAVGRTQAVDRAQSMEQQDIFDGMVLGLPALTRYLCRRGLGADDTPCGPVMGTREDAGTVAKEAGSSALGATTVAASASERSSRGAQAVRERAGACSAASSAGKRIGIHGWVLLCLCPPGAPGPPGGRRSSGR